MAMIRTYGFIDTFLSENARDPLVIRRLSIHQIGVHGDRVHQRDDVELRHWGHAELVDSEQFDSNTASIASELCCQYRSGLEVR